MSEPLMQKVDKEAAKAVTPQTENNIVVDAAKNIGVVPYSTASQILNPQGPVTPFEQQLADYNNKNKGTAGTTTSTVTPPAFKAPRNVEEFLAQNQEAPETPEERMKREKQERTNKIIAGVGDMISALANMYYTTKGAPSSYDPKEGMTPKMQARYDQLQKEREAREKDYLSGLQRARQLDEQYNLSWEQLKQQYERNRLQDERYRRQDEERKRKEEESAKREALKKAAYVRYQEALGNGDVPEAEYQKAIGNGYSPEDAAAIKEAVRKRELLKASKKKATRRRGNSNNRTTVDPYAQYARK